MERESNRTRPCGIGVDIVSVDRIRRAHLRWGKRFLERIFTEEEVCYCFSLANPYPSLAARFAGKEAVAKAIGCGFGRRLTFLSLSITHGGDGIPEVKFVGEKQPDCGTFLISLSHTDEYAIAQVLRFGSD
ncbi:MAG: holo-ACP synthase [Puniceicoccales bacterium]|nr:holo-ACP synthase [Puniceicoccales bacterium]